MKEIKKKSKIGNLNNQVVGQNVVIDYRIHESESGNSSSKDGEEK